MHGRCSTPTTHWEGMRFPEHVRAHRRDLQAFITSGDVLNEVLDHCPDPWLDALHEPMLRLTDLAVAAAKAGQTSAAEAICKVCMHMRCLAMGGLVQDCRAVSVSHAP